MTTRIDDVVVDFVDSPRVIEVVSPFTEFVMQDVVDTVRKFEDNFRGMSEPKLMNASGKEDLGGFIVGITVALQNAQLAFEGRTTPAETGTISTVPGSPIVGRGAFTDASATFITNGVKRGSLVINFDDRSIAEVYSADSETQLTTKTLVNGTTNNYTVGDNYQVYNVIQVTARGGNLTAVDDMAAAISGVLGTPFTQVVIELSSSATIVETGVSGVLPSDLVDFKNAVYDELVNGSEDFRLSMQRILGRLGLDKANPITTGDDNSISFDDVTISAVNGATTTTQTRDDP